MNDDFEAAGAEELMQSVLRNARAHAQPQREELASAFAGVQARLREPAAGMPEAAAPGATAALLGRRAAPSATVELRFASRARLVGWTALAAALGFWLGTRYERAQTPEHIPMPIEVAAPVIAAPAIAAPVIVQAPAAQEPASTDAVAAVTSTPAAASDAPARVNARATRATRATPRQLDFRQVLELLRRAERARQSGSPELALALLGEIDDKAARHVLREERLVTRTLALCDHGDEASARSSARELGLASGDSIYTSRLIRSCVAAMVSEPGDNR